MSITPAELKNYTEFEAVKNRSVEKLKFDILEAETYIDGFIDPKLSTYETLPEKLSLALLKVAQFLRWLMVMNQFPKAISRRKLVIVATHWVMDAV